MLSWWLLSTIIICLAGWARKLVDRCWRFYYYTYGWIESWRTCLSLELLCVGDVQAFFMRNNRTLNGRRNILLVPLLGWHRFFFPTCWWWCTIKVWSKLMYWFVFLPDVRVTEYIEQLIENRNGWSLEEANSRASNYSRGVLVSVSKWLHRTSESHLLLHYVCLFSSLSFPAIAGKKGS